MVTGPTGHGKTSTLAAIVDIINRETTHHVITVEDPVEYVHPRKKAMMSQREVGTHTRSFAAALKASLREDPDVIVVGELRDTETVRMALAASETGHLVLGTMNTPSAAKTIDRLIDLFPPADQQQVRMTLAGGLHLIVSQRLLPATDGQGDGRRGGAAARAPSPCGASSATTRPSRSPASSSAARASASCASTTRSAIWCRPGGSPARRRWPWPSCPRSSRPSSPAQRRPAGAIAARRRRSREAAGGLLGKAGQLFGKRGP